MSVFVLVSVPALVAMPGLVAVIVAGVIMPMAV
jgi:hypothetical protein